MVAVVERGGFLWFYEFLFDFVAFIYFFGPGILLHGGHSHWLTDGGTLGFSDGFITYGQGGWLYVAGFFLICMGLAFCPSFFELSTSGFILLPFWVLSFCEVVVGDLEACFCCCALLR